MINKRNRTMTTVRHCPSVVVHVTVSVSVTNVQAQLVRLHDCNLRPYAKTRITMLITALHGGQLTPSSATRRAQFSQNLACPQGTKAKPSIGANRHTSQHRNGVSAAAGAPGTDAAADALAAVGVNCSSSSSSSELSACWLGCSATV